MAQVTHATRGKTQVEADLIFARARGGNSQFVTPTENGNAHVTGLPRDVTGLSGDVTFLPRDVTELPTTYDENVQLQSGEVSEMDLLMRFSVLLVRVIRWEMGGRRRRRRRRKKVD